MSTKLRSLFLIPATGEEQRGVNRVGSHCIRAPRSGSLTADKLGYVLNEKFGQVRGERRFATCDGSASSSIRLLAQAFSKDDLKYMLRQFTLDGNDTDTVDFLSFALAMHAKMTVSLHSM